MKNVNNPTSGALFFQFRFQLNLILYHEIVLIMFHQSGNNNLVALRCLFNYFLSVKLNHLQTGIYSTCYAQVIGKKRTANSEIANRHIAN